MESITSSEAIVEIVKTSFGILIIVIGYFLNRFFNKLDERISKFDKATLSMITLKAYTETQFKIVKNMMDSQKNRLIQVEVGLKEDENTSKREINARLGLLERGFLDQMQTLAHDVDNVMNHHADRVLGRIKVLEDDSRKTKNALGRVIQVVKPSVVKSKNKQGA